MKSVNLFIRSVTQLTICSPNI